MPRDGIVRRRIKAYLTNHVLTKGIREVDAWFTSAKPDEIKIRTWTKRGMETKTYVQPDWQPSKSLARRYAEHCKMKKIAIWKQQIRELEKLTF